MHDYVEIEVTDEPPEKSSITIHLDFDGYNRFSLIAVNPSGPKIVKDDFQSSETYFWENLMNTLYCAIVDTTSED